jgi:hypothetical protein
MIVERGAIAATETSARVRKHGRVGPAADRDDSQQVATEL